MNIALIGYGNMGQEIEQLVKNAKKHNIVSVNYRKITDKLDIDSIKKADVAIDFTAAEVLLKNIQEIASTGVSLVVGTTGWYNELEKVKDIVTKHNIGLIYGGNFSIGANIFFQIVGHASSLFAKYESMYDVYGMEVHHAGKKDSPSGTAKKLSDTIIKNFPAKKSLQNQTLNRAIEKEELHFTSVRAGRNPGLHEVIFDSQADEVKLLHQAHGRRGFAEGAILAAEFIQNKKGLYRFEDLFTQGEL